MKRKIKKKRKETRKLFLLYWKYPHKNNKIVKKIQNIMPKKNKSIPKQSNFKIIGKK
jgi:hypothetical protein